ncbi:hypothetical protein HanPSC8_Chr12g0513051 [Helianthus annuus]|nr:hypothetical protein HanPSC8_Chr12g0513051 [Helianthus annuus]
MSCRKAGNRTFELSIFRLQCHGNLAWITRNRLITVGFRIVCLLVDIIEACISRLSKLMVMLMMYLPLVNSFRGFLGYEFNTSVQSKSLMVYDYKIHLNLVI